MQNRLADSKSPYLRQHQENPVDWYPWGEEAFARAEALGRPVFLSVGYSACHWCHVMAHESFEDDAVAAILNEFFVCIKVDREERPDVDDAYMTAVQISSGRGGWPMTVFMTPDKKPFFAGTYFPKDDRGDYPGFRSIISQIANGWKEARLEFEHTAHEFASALEQEVKREIPRGSLSSELVDYAIDALWADFDEEFGGFGDAPKFPPHSALAFCWAYAGKHADERGERARHMAKATLTAMIRGGIHDHVGGGFHRYSTDREWRLPHFEKMLYDNALMLDSLEGGGHPAFSETGQRLVAWIKTEMASPDGLFYSALDADSEGEEGKFYVWTYDEVLGLAGKEVCDAYDVRPRGNFHDEATGVLTGANVLLQKAGRDPDELLKAAAFRDQMSALAEAREKRERPGLDDKVIVGWNGLLIAAMARSGEVSLASRTALEILRHDPLPRIVGAADAGFLEDYAAMAMACHALAEASSPTLVLEGDEELGIEAMEFPIADSDLGPESEGPKTDWKVEADRLVGEILDRFTAPEGGFYSTSGGHEILFGQSLPVTDSPIPSANSLALRALLRTDPQHPHLAKSFARFAGWMERAPTACEGLVLAYMEYLDAGQSSVPSTQVEVSLQRIGDELAIVFDIPPGMHINSNQPADEWLIPTSVSAALSYPPGTVYSGRVVIPVSEGVKSVTVTYQSCSETACYAPETREIVNPFT